MDREFFLIRRHGPAGFFLVYQRVAELAREVMLGLGYGDAETPLEWLAPGRGRGASVSMLVRHLTGLSRVDPLACWLSLDRFLSEDTGSFPDIDLDFPRDVRGRLIPRVIAGCRCARRRWRILLRCGRWLLPGRIWCNGTRIRWRMPGR